MKELNAEALRDIADWLDIYDLLALQYFDLLELHQYQKTIDLVDVRKTASGTEVQDDLRRWANEMEQDASLSMS